RPIGSQGATQTFNFFAESFPLRVPGAGRSRGLTLMLDTLSELAFGVIKLFEGFSPFKSSPFQDVTLSQPTLLKDFEFLFIMRMIFQQLQKEGILLVREWSLKLV